MSETIKVTKLNEVFIKIDCEQGIKNELHQKFSFFAPNYKWNPKYKMKRWDGKIYLYNKRTSTIYTGLMKEIAQFCKDNNYKLECDFEAVDNSFSVKEFEDFLKEINLSKTPREYQREAVIKAIRRKRITFLSPTASGKSLIIYLIIRFLGIKTLLIVPTTALVLQMREDFKEYAEHDDWDVEEEISIIMGGYTKDNLNDIVISTWQSIFDMPKEWFNDNDFECVVLDEAHGGKAKSIQTIMENITGAQYRIGLTGTLEDTQMSELTISGLFGPVHKVIETKELIENKTLSNLKLKCLIFDYADEVKKEVSKYKYQDEITYIIENEKRNKFLENLTFSLNGNTLLLFGRVNHGKKLYDSLCEMSAKNPDKAKKVFFIAGEIKAEQREEIRQYAEEQGKDCIIVASTGTFSTGINIVNLHNIIQAHPSKSKIKILQSIGRGLRRSTGKTECTYFDISDDLSWKSKKNYTFTHFAARLKIYVETGFSYKIKKIQI